MSREKGIKIGTRRREMALNYRNCNHHCSFTNIRGIVNIKAMIMIVCLFELMSAGCKNK
jgi:hypothetical protein